MDRLKELELENIELRKQVALLTEKVSLLLKKVEELSHLKQVTILPCLLLMILDEGIQKVFVNRQVVRVVVKKVIREKHSKRVLLPLQ